MPRAALGLDAVWAFLRARMLARGARADALDRAAARARRNLVRAKRAHGAAWRNDMAKVRAVHLWLRDLAALAGVEWADVAADVRALVARTERTAAL
jgi:hypothetical protein